MKLILACVTLVGCVVLAESYTVDAATQTELAFDPELDDMWMAFKKTHNKTYGYQEEFSRRVIWERNVRKIQQHNLEFDLGRHSFSMGINEYSDLTWDEYKRYLLGARPPKVRQFPATGVYQRRIQELPDTVDWRTQGYVTPIKNQGQCGSCWAFSTTGGLEGQHKRKTGQLVSLSEQNLVDCVKGNDGCDGGWMDVAYYYIQTNGGIDTEASYPYQAEDEPCRYNPQGVGASDYGYLDLAKGDEVTLQAAMAEIGPVAVAIDASSDTFMNYRSGVFYDPNCSNVTADHAVLVVGYGTDSATGLDYWLVKNSWGTSWGVNGYIKMSRNRKNNCAIATYATVPMV